MLLRESEDQIAIQHQLVDLEAKAKLTNSCSAVEAEFDRLVEGYDADVKDLYGLN